MNSVRSLPDPKTNKFLLFLSGMNGSDSLCNQALQSPHQTHTTHTNQSFSHQLPKMSHIFQHSLIHFVQYLCNYGNAHVSTECFEFATSVQIH